MALETIGVSSSIAGLLSLGITVCQGLVSYYDSYKNAESDIRAMCGSIEALQITFKILGPRLQSSRLQEDVRVNAETSVSSCANSLRNLHDELQKIQLNPQSQVWLEHAKVKLLRLQYPFKEATLAKLKAIISDLRNNLSLALNVLYIDANMTAFDGLEKRMDNVGELFANVHLQMKTTELAIDAGTLQLREEEWEKVLDWLSPLRGKFEMKQAEVFDTNSRQDGFAHEIIEGNAFVDWMFGTSKTLWCYGKSGVGKSVFCSIAVNYLQKAFQKGDAGIAFIFCSHKDRNDQTPVNLLSSLLSQLLCQKSISRAEVFRIYNSHRAKKTNPSLSEIHALLKDAISFFPKVFIIVDALDECPQGENRRLLLSRLREFGPAINLLITSRRTPSIALDFERLGNLEIRATDGDITSYLKERVTGATEEITYFIEKDETLYPIIVKNILEKANGRFLLARLHLESLLAETDLRSFKKALAELPDTIWSMYDDMMARIDAQNSRRAILAKRAMSWVFYASRPFTTEELQHALSVEKNDTGFDKDGIPRIEVLLSSCACFLEVQNNTLVLIHYTAREYFKNRGEKLFPTAHANIAATCLTYLLFHDFAEGPCETEEDLQKRLRDYPFLKYAARNWGYHFIHDQERISSLAEKFLRSDSSLASSVQIIDESIKRLPETEDQRHKFLRARQHDLRHVHKMWIAAGFDLVNIVKQVLDAGIKATDTTGYGEDALHMAARMGHVATATLLLQFGADISAKNEFGFTALHIAAGCGNDALLKLLLQDCKSINDIDVGGDTALNVASYCGRTAMVELLLRHGADPNVASATKASALHYAAERGDISTVRILVKFGASVDTLHESGKGPIHDASLHGHLSVVKFLVESGAHFEAVDTRGKIPLHYSAPDGHLSIAKFFVECGSNVNAADNSGNIPLHFAAQNGHLALVKFLLECGSNIETTGRNEMTALHHGVERGHLPVTKFLIDCGAKIEACDISMNTALHYAAWKGQFFAAEFLVHSGAQIEVTNAAKNTPLHLAANNGHLLVAKNLIDCGSKINCKDEKESTPLHHAANNGHLPMVELLIERGCEIEPTNKFGDTPLHQAASKGELLVAKFLVKHGSKINVSNEKGDTPLHHAARNGHLPVVDFLTESGSNIGVPNGSQWTALRQSAQKGHLPVVEFLIEHGAQIDVTDTLGITPLHSAAIDGNLPIVECLVLHGAEVDSSDQEGGTALHYAACFGHLAVAKFLIENRAATDALDNYGWTPLVFAVDSGHSGVVEYLLDVGCDFDHVTESDNTALGQACMKGDEAIASLLLKRGAKVEAWSETQNFTALALAVVGGNSTIVQLLLDAGAAIGPKTNLEVPALSLATLGGDLPMIQILLDSGAHTEVRQTRYDSLIFKEFCFILNERGKSLREGYEFFCTPLEHAAYQGYKEVLIILLDRGARIGRSLFCAVTQGHMEVANILSSRGADVNSENPKSPAPLAYAAERGMVDIVKWLLEKGADVNARNEIGLTAIKFAIRRKEAEVVRILLDNGADAEDEHNLDQRMMLWLKRNRLREIVSEADKLFPCEQHSQCCDICDRAISDTEIHYHCPICNYEEGFDVCQNCLDKGHSCPESHQLSKYQFLNGQKTNLGIFSLLM